MAYSALPTGSIIHDGKIYIPPTRQASGAGSRTLRHKGTGQVVAFPGALPQAYSDGATLVVIVGDSNSANSQGVFVPAGEHWNENLLNNWLGERGTIWNAAFGGATAESAINRIPQLLDNYRAGHPQYTKQIGFVMVGTNNQNDETAAGAIEQLGRLKFEFHSRGIPFVISTCIVPFDNPTICNAINAYIRANWQSLGALALLDFSNDVRLRYLTNGVNQAGWVDNGNGNWDKLHWNGLNHRRYFVEYVLPQIDRLISAPTPTYTPPVGEPSIQRISYDHESITINPQYASAYKIGTSIAGSQSAGTQFRSVGGDPLLWYKHTSIKGGRLKWPTLAECDMGIASPGNGYVLRVSVDDVLQPQDIVGNNGDVLFDFPFSDGQTHTIQWYATASQNNLWKFDAYI